MFVVLPRVAVPVLLFLAAGGSYAAEADGAERPIGRWPNGFSYSIVVDRAGAFAYAASGGTVLVTELADPANASAPAASPIAEVRTEGFVFGLALDGDDLFVAGSRDGFFRIDVSDPTKPGPAKRIGAADDVAFDVAARGDVVAFADGSAGVAFFRRAGADVVFASRVPLEKGRALGVALGDGFAIVAGAEGDVLRIDLADLAKPTITARSPSTRLARSVALTTDGRYALVAEDMGDLTVRDVTTLAIVTRKHFVLPANPNPGPQRSPKPESALGVARVRTLGDRAYVGLEGTEMTAQISPYTPEFGAWRGEPHYDPRAATAVLDLAPGREGTPKLAILGFADDLRSRSWLNWIKDVAPLPNGDFLALDFVTGAYRFRPTTEKPRRDGLPGLVEVRYEVDTRAGAIDCVFSPSNENLVYASSDMGGLQIIDVSDRANPRLVHRIPDSGGTFCAVSTRMEKDDQGVERAFDYVFINNFFRVGICRADPKNLLASRMLKPLWITLPDAIRGKQEFDALGLTPRSYRVAVEGDFLDVVSTNTVFGWQRFSITEVLAWTHVANIHEGIQRPPEFARDCPPLFRAVTSPDHLADSSALTKAPFARAGKLMGFLASGSNVFVGSGAQREAPGGGSGRGGRGGGGAPFDGYLQYFDLTDPVVADPVLGSLRFPRGTRFIPGGEVQIGLAMRGNELFVADSAGYVRVVDFVEAPAASGAHGEAFLVPRSTVYENHGHYGLDSIFDVVIDGDCLHVAGWSSGYVRLSIAESGSPGFLTEISRFDSPGLPISIALAKDGSVVVAEHNAGILVFAPRKP